MRRILRLIVGGCLGYPGSAVGAELAVASGEHHHPARSRRRRRRVLPADRRGTAKALGQPFVVENRPGGGLNIGSRACAEAAPDGYTFCVLSGEPVVYNQFTFKNLPYNPEKDFEPVVNLFINANALVVNA